jgi:ubiquinone/menaquinone biosynthesis C-methylase UbiE
VHERDGTSPEESHEYRQRSYQSWEQAASGWDRQRAYVREATRALNRWLVEALELRPGGSVLELAAGPGETSLELAELVGRSGRVVCTDHSPNMVAAAEREARERGIDWMQCRVMDGEALDLPDGQLDAVACRLGLMLMADPARAAGEGRRVLRAGGRMAVVVWGDVSQNPWATTWWAVLEKRIDLPPTPPGAPGMFALGDPQRLTAVLETGGLQKVRTHPIPMTWDYESFEHLWDVQRSLNSALRNLTADLAGDEVETAALRADVAEAMAGFRTPAGGYRFPALAMGAVGSAPGR